VPTAAQSADPVADLVAQLQAAGPGGRRVVLVGSGRNVGTTVTAIALGRALSDHGSTVLVDLALGSPNLSVFATNPHASGIAELVRGHASFGDIITRDHFSQLHLILAGRPSGEPPAILAAQRLATVLEALTRTYDYLLLDAGAIADGSLDGLARFAPRAVLVAGNLRKKALTAAQTQLHQAGFAEVTVIEGPPPKIDGRMARAA
jgi:MinD-like ATPase involved in chromosome partitioning or flagellar assembly